MEMLRFKSGSQNWVDGNSELTFRDFIDVRGPNGGRVVIDGFWVHGDIQLDVAGTAVDGEDAPRAIHTLTIEQKDGRARWKLKGDATRLASILMEGIDRYHESADSAVANNTPMDFAIYVPFTKRFAKRPKDFALPAEVLKELTIKCGDAADIDVAGGTVTVDGSGTSKYYIIPVWHEEFSLEIKAEDEVKQTPVTSTTELEVHAAGKLHDLFLYARGAGGGADLANLTDIQIAEGADGGGGGAVAYMPKALLKDPDLVVEYRRKRNAADSGTTAGGERYLDPFTGSTQRACAVLMSDKTTRVFDGPYVDRVRFTMTNSVADLFGVSRAVKPKSTDLLDAMSRKHRITPDVYKVKTAGKTRQNAASWPPAAKKFMPLKAPLRRK